LGSYKNQHFVPRCYLRPFSSGGKARAINLYNLDRCLGIRNAPLKSQCSANYFYGEDLRLEKTFQKMEGMYAQTLRSVQTLDYTLNEGDKTVLRYFCYLQYCRTEATLRRLAMSMSEIVEIAEGKAGPERSAVMRDSVLAGMRAFADSMSVVRDLKVCLVRNCCRSSLVTSDNPAVMTNRWYQQNSKARGRSGGAGSAGVLFLLPMTPKILCLVYDGDVYNIQNQGGWVTVKKDADVEALNEHQFLHGMANIYFPEWNDLAEIGRAAARTIPRRPAVRHEVSVAVLDQENAWGKRYRVIPRDELIRKGEALFHIREIPLRPTRWPAVIRWRPDPKVYSNGSGTGFVRRWTIESGTRAGSGYVRVR
jgi:uncharacterized protein DUF4238